MIILSSSLLIGFIRLCLIALFVFYLYKKFIRNAHLNFIDFIVQNWFRYGSAYLLVALVLSQINAYNLFNCFFVFFFLLLVDHIGLKNLRNLKHYFGTNVKIGFLQLLRTIELGAPLKNWIILKEPKSEVEKNQNKLLFLLTIVLVIITFLSRYYFIIFDNYSLSDPWAIDIGKMINLDNQQWFGQDFTPIGELAILNFYSKIADITPEISLHFASIFEAILLSILLFWSIHKITTSKYIAPLVTSLIFALVYVLSPHNVYFLLQTNSILMALTIAIPTFVYMQKPELLRMSTLSLHSSFFVAFFAIGLTDFFVFFIVTPVFIALLFISSLSTKGIAVLKMAACYLAAVLVFLSMYGLISLTKQLELVSFFKVNLVSISAYSYFPQLFLPLKNIIKYLQYFSIAASILALVLILLKRGEWKNTLVFLLFFNGLIFLAEMNYSWIDVEKIKVLFIILFPMVIGLGLALLLSVFEVFSNPLQQLQPLTLLLILASMVYYSIKYQDVTVNKLKHSDKVPKEILNGYDKIAQVFYPNTYTVVNDHSTQVISTNRHQFMNYDYFIAEYLTKDSIFTQNKKNKLFLANNPTERLPKSVLVFVINSSNKSEHNLFAENAKLTKSVLQTLQVLKQRGRRIQVFYKSDLVTIYEIINVPGASKMHDLVFTKR